MTLWKRSELLNLGLFDDSLERLGFADIVTSANEKLVSKKRAKDTRQNNSDNHNGSSNFLVSFTEHFCLTAFIREIAMTPVFDLT